MRIKFLLCFAIYFLNLEAVSSKNVTVLGTGYVGLVLGACLSEWGHDVICADIQEDKILQLQNGNIPIFEPGLSDLVKKNHQAGRLNFTTNIAQAIRSSSILFIAVGTPTLDDGNADITALVSAIKLISENTNEKKIICIKSTVPVGTTRSMESILTATLKDPTLFEICFCPEFLREGSAVADFFKTDRLVIGVETELAKEEMRELFYPLLEKNTPLLECNYETAEAIKYASNAFLAAKISFINEFSHFAKAVGADILGVAEGMGLDKRIGPDFLKPGPGYGGSCFPKDTAALLYQSQVKGIELKLISATVEANEDQKIKMVEKLSTLLSNDMEGKVIAILGLSFKSNTDDVRMSPAIKIISTLLEKGATIQAYDPIAALNMKKIFPQITYCESIQQAVTHADAAVILTEWDEIQNLNLSQLLQLMKSPILLDTRNLLDPNQVTQLGFKFDNNGRL